jgi:hypothetical protein
MACNSFYDFISGARIQLRVRAILTPSEEARSLIRDQVRMLSELSCATPNV